MCMGTSMAKGNIAIVERLHIALCVALDMTKLGRTTRLWTAHLVKLTLDSFGLGIRSQYPRKSDFEHKSTPWH